MLKHGDTWAFSKSNTIIHFILLTPSKARHSLEEKDSYFRTVRKNTSVAVECFLHGEEMNVSGSLFESNCRGVKL